MFSGHDDELSGSLMTSGDIAIEDGTQFFAAALYIFRTDDDEVK